jgi:hypothetical protein
MFAGFHLFPFPFTESEKGRDVIRVPTVTWLLSFSDGRSLCVYREKPLHFWTLPAYNQSIDLASRHIHTKHKYTSHMDKIPAAQLTFNPDASPLSPLIPPGTPFLMKFFLFQPLPTGDQLIE